MAGPLVKFALAQCTELLGAAPQPWIGVLERGDMLLELFQPRGKDTQGPHDRDEIYIVASGSGTFVCGEAQIPFVTGDVLYVPAFVAHRFESFSADFHTWVIFFGPKDGTAVNAAATE
jgi:mannose-6-phosphate isomerase-like protein (cupin superfamily)